MRQPSAGPAAGSEPARIAPLAGSVLASAPAPGMRLPPGPGRQLELLVEGSGLRRAGRERGERGDPALSVRAPGSCRGVSPALLGTDGGVPSAARIRGI